MKKISPVIFLCICFLAGCSGGPYDAEGYNKWGYNRDGYHRDGHALFGSRDPSKPRKTPAQILTEEQESLAQEQAMLTQKDSALSEKYESLNTRLAAFVSGLSDEELKVYEKYISSAQTNLAAWELSRRALYKILTEEHVLVFFAINQDYMNLEAENKMLLEQIQAYNQRVVEHNQQLLAYQQEVARKQQARQAVGRALQQASQDYYNRQMKSYQEYNQRSMMQFDLQESQRRQTNRLLRAKRGY